MRLFLTAVLTALCAAAVAAGPAAAARRVVFHADVRATVTTQWQVHHSEPGCAQNTQLTEDGNGTQTVTFRVTHQRVVLTFVGPGAAQFRTDPIALHGSFRASRKGAMVTDDPACGGSQSDPTQGCGDYKGRASVRWNWPVSPSNKLFLDAAPLSMNHVDCPFFDTNGSLARFGLPLPGDGAPWVRYTPLKLARFAFHTRRGRLTWHRTRTWTVQGSMNDPGDVDQATNKMSWTVTLHRAH